ncbi:hybrid non-ribosomal peptide synthetase/type I polyketide synthase [Paenibacillus xylaniclasticus]|uniref:hybrid non-ribosomal peptide synthetase/type I polyketide synthase n=1 Tax=Paenibacillus xylaniclasticus TaxID=588083 RepID=UPI000FDCBCBA|nr:MULTISPECIES: type I polyketide synthase [Paenibacillus]GFN30065.1 hypothetical protein PCURB6_03250 [Paenibacillus curdlanolyticus]
MKDYLHYILSEVKSGRMRKEDAFRKLRQWQAQRASQPTSQSEEGNGEFLSDCSVLMLEPCWKEQADLHKAATPEFGQRLVVLCELDGISERTIEARLKGARCIQLQAVQGGMGERFQAYALQLLAEVQSILKDNNRDSVLIQIVVSSPSGQQPFAGLLGILQTAEKENPKITGQLIELDFADVERLMESLEENSRHPKVKRVRYENGKRLVLGWNEMKPIGPAGQSPWKHRGVYLITGGMGGLGLVFAREIVRQVSEAVIVLVGRSMLSGDKQAVIEELRAQGARVEYRRADVARTEETARLVHSIREEFGVLNGIIHSAGVIQDRFLINKTPEEFADVIAPKVMGLVNLDEMTKDQELDFFILFSSIAGVMGNPGQADYSAANAFMDAYAAYRNGLSALKLRKGQTLSVNWPLWKDGGMRVDEETEIAWRSIGMVAMQESNGIKALYDALASGQSQAMVIEGTVSRLREHLLSATTVKHTQDEELDDAPDNPNLLAANTLQRLKLLFGEVTKLSIDKIDASEPLESYGIDSIMITRLNQKLREIFNDISMTLFYEYQTLEALADYFVTEYPKECMRWTGGERKPKPAEEPAHRATPFSVKSEPATPPAPEREEKIARRSGTIEGETGNRREPIAIIGISGRYPKAKNIEEYWSNLEKGEDCITEIPADRWKMEHFYSPDIKEAVEKGWSYGKWGGFIDEFADFDPLFFNISPREAMSMDPQERIFLEECWKVFEDAGYTREQLAAKYKGRVGVFAGITGTGFNLYGPGLWKRGQSIFPRTSFSSVANRVSYFLNLKGPSLPIDSMCSSSLTAIHEACEHIYNGECEMAIAGGVNLYLHPSSYVFLSAMRMLSPDGRCKSFGAGGNGFVPGEGAGVVLLKPLSRAIADNDQIYAVIRGTSINHGGKTNGYTVPNPVAQGELIREALDKAGVNARTVSYIEAHGTGTELGDPIEITGLTQAFRKDTQDTNYCAIGSVKSNIGHLESAAGIAGITKIILQMKHRKIVPSLNAERLNPNIHFAKTPFVVQQELAEWKRPVIEENGERREYPRIAGISSFGAGGANAHLILEEFIPQEHDCTLPPVSAQGPAVIVLSAKNHEALKEQAARLASFLDQNQLADCELADIAYTLQSGREAMEERLAVVVESVKELGDKLRAYVMGRTDITQLYQGRSRQDNESPGITVREEVSDAAVELWINMENYDKLAAHWVSGVHIDWDKLYGGVKPRRISLPPYPFARERYWITVEEDKPVSGTERPLHPLLHRNTSVLSEQRFSSIFGDGELYWKDVTADGGLLLREAVCLEMARAAIEQSLTDLEKGQASIVIKDTIWTHAPVHGEMPLQVHIGLFSLDQGEIEFQIYIYMEGSTDSLLLCRGSAELMILNEAETLNITELQADCTHLAIARLYDRTIGADTDLRNQVVEQVQITKELALAKLSLPNVAKTTEDHFVLHPSLIDAALQLPTYLMSNTVNDFQRPDKAPQTTMQMTALESLELFGTCAPEMWAVARHRAGAMAQGEPQKYDIDLCDKEGRLCVRLKGCAYEDEDVSETATGCMILQPFWDEQAVSEEAADILYECHVVMLCETGRIASEHVEAALPGVECIAMHADGNEIERRYESYAVQVFEKVQSLLNDKPKGNVLVQIVTTIDREAMLFSGLSGILNTARKENPRFHGQLLEVEAAEETKGLVHIIKQSSRRPEDKRIRFAEGKRLVPVWEEIELSSKEVSMPWKDRGIYLITGGAKGVGYIVATDIARQARDAVLIVTGRSPLNRNIEERLEQLKALGTRAEYRTADVTRKEEVTDLIEQIRATYGGLNGILHSAGIIKDNYMIKKTTWEFREVLAPKVAGLVHLDKASKDIPLDFFVLFSSGSGVGGNAGQSDYAAANAFMDVYASYRNSLVSDNRRSGKTLSINWPLWKDGGMRLDSHTEAAMRQAGMYAMKSETGIRALYQCISLIPDQAMVVEGDIEAIRRMMGLEGQIREGADTVRGQARGTEATGMKSVTFDNDAVLREKTANYLKELLSSSTGLPAYRIEEDTPLENYGVDSIKSMEINDQLEKTFGSLSRTVLFEYPNVRSLTEYFLETYRERLVEWFGLEQEVIVSSSIEAGKPVKPVQWAAHRTLRPRYTPTRVESQEDKRQEQGMMDIAVIGVAGKYPGADNIEQFWRNLQEGKDCITEIPRDRWDHAVYYDKERNKPGKTYCKWGGFMDRIDPLDPAYFHLTPYEVSLMDPMEQLFVQVIWNLLESAGYTRETLQKKHESKVGVYIGATYHKYCSCDAGMNGEATNRVSHFGSVAVANPISHYFNFQGPSISIDTMSSSSAVAVHMACESLRRGECQLAVAGGGNLLESPKKFIESSQNQLIGSHEGSRSFADGDGFLPAEGAGAVLLKPLRKAVQDGDCILAVIKSSATNHGGNSQGFTTPNLNAQAQLIEDNFAKVGIDPRTVSYVEAAANGSSLGDSIEIAALSKAFRKFTNEQQYCAIGSVKSNIGHAEAASGISQLTKVILQLWHRKLVPHIKADKLNPNINFSSTPFYLQRELQEWKRPVIELQGEAQEAPLRATVSSFGVGGSNVHFILEEYLPPYEESAPIETNKAEIVVLSDNSKERLLVAANQLHHHLEQHPAISLQELAYTLQTGREAMKWRVAMVVSSREELLAALREFVVSTGKENGADREGTSIPLFTGECGEDASMGGLLSGKVGETVSQMLVEENNLEKIALYWIQGGKISWEALHGNKNVRRVSLPTSTFGTKAVEMEAMK